MESLTPALKTLLETLERLCIRYLVGGSLASSARGVCRATADTDLLVEIDAPSGQRLMEELGPHWHGDAGVTRESIRSGRAFNLIYIPGAEKFALFPALDRFHFSELERATPAEFEIGGCSLRCLVASVEDILLAKLQWYRLGGEVSEVQWRDVAGIIAANPRMDRDYLAEWAPRLAIVDLLERALGEPEV